jgi:hypothetical protein
MVAQLLASQDIDVYGKHLNIFSPKYDQFREMFSSTTTTITPSNADDDFFNIGNGGSEILLLSKENFSIIFHADTTGDWPAATQAKCTYFVNHIVERYDDLERNGPPDAFRNYKREIKAKMEYVIENGLSHPNCGLMMPGKTLPNGKPAFLEMMRRGIITVKSLERLKAERDNKVAGRLLEQWKRETPVTPQNPSDSGTGSRGPAGATAV